MLYGSMFGTIFGSCISGSVYCNQSFTFRKPVYIDERVTARIEVISVRTSPHHMATCKTAIIKADGIVACEGEATVMLPPPLK
jgi:acyl dehydratase